MACLWSRAAPNLIYRRDGADTVVSMSISLQVISITPKRLDSFRREPAVTSGFVMQHDCQDVVGDDFETIWLDKSAMGILEAFGVLDASAEPPAAWVLGATDTLRVGDASSPYLTPDQTRSVAEWISQVSDAEFAELAASNTINNDVDYLTPWFTALRAFYGRAAEQNRAVVHHFSG